jgi:hypothetical protein
MAAEERDMNTASIEAHAHHWKIDEPTGPTSSAICKNCGATRIFKNWLLQTDIITNEEHRSMQDRAA